VNGEYQLSLKALAGCSAPSRNASRQCRPLDA